MKKKYLMNKKTKIYLLIANMLCGAALFSACNEADLSQTSGEEEPELLWVDSIGAVFAGADDDDIEIPLEDPFDHTDNFEAEDILQDVFTNNGSRIDTLFFSQLVTGKLLPFQSVPPDRFPANMSEYMREKFADGYPNVYKYYYQDRYTSTWDDDPGGYNFFPIDTLSRMNWDDIKFWGLNNTGYALYALYYPYNNKLPYDEDGNLNFYVESNQTTKEALRKSNFMGAYHSSSKSGQRLKFKLYHLTAYIKVTLYIPVFNPNDKIINSAGKEETIRSGFPADALQSAQIRDVYNHFRINWYGGRSSDTAPITAVTTDTLRTNIDMYIPGPEDYVDNDGLPPIVKIRVPDFVREALNDNTPEFDECWKITVSGLVPGGQDYPIGDEQYPMGQTWTDLNFLRFDLRQNIGEVPKRYVFTGLSTSGLIGSGDNINIGQGKLQHLNLYIPRYGAPAVLLNAYVEDWEQWYNDNMGLTQDDPLDSQNSD